MISRELLERQSVRQGGLLLVLLVVTLLFPGSIPLGIYGLGATAGLLLALQALAIVLVYRSNRIINFSQAATGALGAYVFQCSASYRPGLRWFSFLCGDDGCGSTAITVNYWVSLVIGLALPVLLSGAIYLLVVRRFAQAPRLLLTVATIFVGPAIGTAYKYVTDWLSTAEDLRDAKFGGAATAFPVDSQFSAGGAVFRAIDVLTAVVAVTVTVALLVYLRRSRAGVSIRAAAESPDRASTLGIDVSSVTIRIWLMSGLLSGVASLLAATASDDAVVGGDVSALLVLLTGAAIASFTSLPLALLACVVLGATKQAAFYSFGTTGPFLGALLLVLAVTFALQRSIASRGEIELASSLATGREVRPVPRELSGLAAVKAWRRAGAVTLLIVLLATPVLLSPAQVDGLTTILALSVIALSLLVLTGWAGQISLGQIGFAGVGAWVAAASGLPVYVALPLGVLAGAVAALVVGLPALRLRGLHLAVISLAFGTTVVELLINPEYGGKALPVDLERPRPLGFELEEARVFYYLVLAAVVLTVVSVLGLRRSRTARALIAARDNELAAQALGISLLRARLTAFAVSGGLAALGGVLLAYQQHAVQVATFNPGFGIYLFQMAVLGGLGHVSGPLLGSGVLQLPGLFALPAVVVTLISGPFALAIVLLVPGGLAQSAFDLRDNVLRRLARREGIAVPSLEGPTGAGEDTAAPLLPRSEGTASETYVPARYRLSGQWALGVHEGERR